MRAIDGRHSLRRHAEETLRPSAAFRGWGSGAGLHVAFCFQTVQGGIDGADRHLASNSQLYLTANGNPVSLVIQTQNCEKYNVLEFAEVVATRH